MLITYLKDTSTKYIQVTSSQISTFYTSTSYVSIQVKATIDCCPEITQTYTRADALTGAGYFYVNSNGLFIKPTFFSDPVITDGVYKITIVLYTASGSVQITNCTFVDVLTKCRVAAYLKDLLVEIRDNSILEPIASMVHLLHYGLINGGNCNCNCDELCKAYAELDSMLNNLPAINSNNCGC